jgi:hypothetical protein
MKPRRIDPGQSVGAPLYDHDADQARRARERSATAQEAEERRQMALARLLAEAIDNQTVTCPCGQPAIWTVTAKGKKMMVDPALTTEHWPRFTLEALSRRMLRAVTVPRSETDTPGHVAHFMTCPLRDNFRKPKGDG